MKYPEYRLSMEAALPSSVHSWLKNELDQRGIDSHVYTRYVISLLLQNENDDLDLEVDLFCPSKSSVKRKGRKLEKKKLSISDEERRKLAAIECLSDMSEEKSDIKELIDELCVRLKDSVAEATVSPIVKSQCSSSDSSEDSGTENQNSTERYYAAFPSLHGKSSPSSASSTVAAESVWKNNPLVKPVSVTHNSSEDSSSSIDDLEVKKINKSPSLPVPKHKKARKNSSRNNKDSTESRKTKNNNQKSKASYGNQNKEGFKQDSQMKPWPPGFAKLEALQDTFGEALQDIYDAFGDEVYDLRAEAVKRPNEELCTKVESILKGMLLPVPDKAYKHLQDVDIEEPGEQRERCTVSAEKSRTFAKTQESLPSGQKPGEENVQESESGELTREASVSPELQEQEIWYTQPITEIFQSPNENEEVGCSKLRLYKRNSYPLFSPESTDGKEDCTDLAQSSASSPVLNISRCYSTSSNDSNSILESSVYMPTWLTEEISVDQNQELSSEVEQAYMSSFHASSPFVSESNSASQFSKSLESTFSAEDTAWGEAAFSIPPPSADHLTLDTDLYNPWSVNSDENLTPTPDEPKTVACIQSPAPALSVSLVDWNYLSNFLCDSDLTPFFMEDGFMKAGPRRTCLSSLSDNQVLFDFTVEVDDYASPQLGMFGIYCWQPVWNEEHSLSQLWDVNMQKRSKVSPWGCPSFFSSNQVWVSENTFVLYNTNLADKEGKDKQEENENTLIPWISIDLFTETNTSTVQDTEQKSEDVDTLSYYFDKSFSLSDVPALFEEGIDNKEPDPKLSKSFELVPSETSAFYDVPRRLMHVHSEPNLVQFRQDYGEGSQSLQHSPQEHLYFSPKTHFRPITPAFAPELSTSKAKQQVCHDLFGGLPSTKTPYQQYHNYEDTSDEDTFVPKFKVKNSCKSIQTGDSIDKPESPSDSNETGDRDTPQTLTMGMIEDVMGDKDDPDWLFPISEDLEAANADSAYETDYGLSAIDSEQDDSTRPVHGECSFRTKKSLGGDQINSLIADHGNLGDPMNYSIKSFMATFPHTQDWPDISHSCDFLSGHSQWSDKDGGQFQMASSWPKSQVFPDPPPDLYPGDPPETGLLEHHDSWLGDLFSDHQYNETDIERYKNIWTAGDDEIGGGLVPDTFPFDMSNFQDEFDMRLPCRESSPQADRVDSAGCTHCSQQESIVGVTAPCCEQTNKSESDELSAPQIGSEVDSLPVNSGDLEWVNPGDYFSVKLVYKDKKCDQDQAKQCQKSYGSFDLMPMPGEAVLSTELEKEWMDPNAVLFKPSSMQRKPCSFYLEGNCRRADCKFAHDISNITCRFWEEGDCFKGPLCPFLHGYPRVTSGSPGLSVPEPEASAKDKFSLNTEEFPELALSVKNGNTSSRRVSKPVTKVLPSARRDRPRKSSSRRHSNKENKAEARLLDKCSSSL